MKVTTLFAALVLFVFSGAFAPSTKKIKEGKLVYTISYPEMEDEQFLAMMPKEQVIYFKNGNTRVESESPMMGKMIGLYIAKTGEQYSMMTMEGNKVAVKMDKKEMDKFQDMVSLDTSSVKLMNETKIIAGYKCKKAVATMKIRDEKKDLVGWYTDELELNNQGMNNGLVFPGVKGVMLESTIVERDMVMKIVCTSIEKISIPDSMFILPPDYKVVKMEEMMQELSR